MIETLEPNKPVDLGHSTITSIDDEPVEIPVNLVLRLLPVPTLVIEGIMPISLWQDRPVDVRLQNGARLAAILGSLDLNTGEGTLVPQCQPVDVYDNGLPLREASFAVINFPELRGNQSQLASSGSNTIAISHVTMEGSDWHIELTGVPNISEVCKTLQRDRGYGITYTGRITRASGNTFSAKKAHALLDAFRSLLSFARGSACSITHVEGHDEHGVRSWIRWGTHHVDSWRQRTSWFRELNGADALSEIFPKYWELVRNDHELRNSMRRAIDWYTVSNISPPYVGIILTQAALEGLSHQELGRKKKRRESTGQFMSCAMKGMGIDIGLDVGCQKLQELAKQGRLPKNGPEAIARVRNDLIHAKPTLGELPNEAHHQAWNLGQWYIERMLLRKFDYHGLHYDRVTGERYDQITR